MSQARRVAAGGETVAGSSLLERSRSSPDQWAMSPTIRCPQCRVALNIPSEAGDRRLKCPKCGAKFHAQPNGSVAATLPDSGSDLGHGQPDLPTVPRDLRETFDLPLLRDDADPQSRVYGSAAFLLADDGPDARQRAEAAEARRRSRPCPACGDPVAQGLSLCRSCGFDLDAGESLDVEPIPEVPPPLPPPPATVGVILVGSAALASSAVLLVLTLGRFGTGLVGLLLGGLCVFGGVGSVQFLRGRSAAPLIVALILGGLIDIIGLIALPVYQAHQQPAVPPSLLAASGDEPPPLPNPNLRERLDIDRIRRGVVLLLLDATMLILVATIGAQRRIEEPSL